MCVEGEWGGGGEEDEVLVGGKGEELIKCCNQG